MTIHATTRQVGLNFENERTVYEHCREGGVSIDRIAAMTTRGRGIAPLPPPGSSGGGASSPASVSSNAYAGSPMTKRLGLIRERSDGAGSVAGGNGMIGSSSSALSLNSYSPGTRDVACSSHNMTAAATSSADSLGAWGGASNRQVGQSTNFNEILLEEERKQSRDNDSPDESVGGMVRQVPSQPDVRSKHTVS